MSVILSINIMEMYTRWPTVALSHAKCCLLTEWRRLLSIMHGLLQDEVCRVITLCGDAVMKEHISLTLRNQCPAETLQVFHYHTELIRDLW